MRELTIGKNEENQRLDRFVGKYLDLAPKNFINRMIRKKNIELNNKKANNNTILKKGDKVQLFLSEKTIEKFRSELEIIKSDVNLGIVYEDQNIIAISKPAGILSHSDGKNETGNDVVSWLINYLIENKVYDPKREISFIPSISNRLDKNTSGIVLAGKNAETVRQLNKAIKDRKIKRYYKTIVYGEMKQDVQLKDYMKKDNNKNKSYIVEKNELAKEIRTDIKILSSKNNYSLVEVELITGRTHQIRLHLNSIGHPIIGEKKYTKLNNKSIDNINLDYQLLHAYKVSLNGFRNDLDYLNGKEFIDNSNTMLNKLENTIFRGKGIGK